MKEWTEYKGHERDLYIYRGKIFDNTVYTFDIETTTIVLYNNTIHTQDFYDRIPTKEKKKAEVYGFMYLWQFSIDDQVYYGRTWYDFKKFYQKVFKDTNISSIVYVHNLSMEMQFLRNILNITKVFARQRYKPIYFENKNITFRCSYYLTQAKLEKLPKLYNLPVEKLTGYLDYKKIRHYTTPLSNDELIYAEHDCLVVYELIKKFKSEYKKIQDIPLTKTGILRRTCKTEMSKSKSFRCKMRDLINLDREFFNTEVRALMGGYVHANFFLSGDGVILKDVDSFDLTSSYPFVMTSEPCFPQQAFRVFTHTPLEKMQDKFIYILHLKITNLKATKQNTILSLSKCFNITKKHNTDNGRFLYAESLECCITNYDYTILKEFYTFDTELIKMWGAPAGYLPRDFIKFILKMYEKKTTLKGVKGKEEEYARVKSDYNSLFGMAITNTIRDEIVYEDDKWVEKELTTDDIDKKLKKESKKLFLNFAYGVFITSVARYNLLSCVSKLDKFNIYSDTDSLKLMQGYDKKVIHEYNIQVIKKIKRAKEKLKLSGYTQKDIKGTSHTLGIFEHEKIYKDDEFTYKKFITQGAKKYAYEDSRGEIGITVAGVPKKGSKCLKKIEDFKTGLIFDAATTGKLQLFYNEEKDINLTVTDYTGNTEDIYFSYGVGLVPCSYTLQESSIYQEFSDDFIERRIYHNDKR